MITIVEPYNADRYANLLEQMYRLRARIFGDRLKWEVLVTNGMERDRFDDVGPTYLIDADEDTGLVRGSLRLLPTTGPTLLADLFSDTIPANASISAPAIWECTRFCVDSGHLVPQELIFGSSILICALGELALKVGIQSILGNFDSTMLRLYRKLGCRVHILGATQRYGSTIYLGSFPVSTRVVGELKATQRLFYRFATERREAMVA